MVPPKDTLSDPRARYALGQLSRLVGLPQERENEIAGSLPAATRDDWDDPRPDPARLRPPDRLGDFDVLYATYACLTAPWETVDPVDAVGCPLASEGWLARNGLLERALVHEYARLVADTLGLSLPERHAAIVLTHDVDDNFAHLFGRRERWARLRRAPSPRRVAGLARSLARPQRVDPNDRFDEWLDLHRRLGSRPSFFFATRGLLHGGDLRDVAYDVGHPDVRSTLRRLVDAGAELGVHFSIAAADATQLREEREELERVAGAPVLTSRSHWWRTVPPRHVEAAGVRLDLSLGFNDRIGFRRGIATPFRPYDRSTGRPADVWELPTLVMDGAVRTAADLERLWTTVREVNGSLVLDWHVHAPNRDDLAYPDLLEFMDGAGPSFVTPLDTLP